jgi:hypothetical protein
MADSYILNIKPAMSATEGKKLENDLNRRFTRVATKFGGALKDNVSKLRGTIAGAFTRAMGSIKGIVAGTIAGAIATIMSNPIEQLNASMDNILKKADNLSTRAGQIGTTSGRLAQVQAVAETSGMTNFDMIISRFQTELGKARTGESETLKEFADEKDTLTAFLRVIDSIKALKPAEQNVMISKIFGERANLQMAEFMQADLIGRRQQIFGNTTEEKLTKAIDSLAKKEDLQAILRQKNAVEDLLAKSKMITEGTIRLQNQYEKSQMNLENKKFASYGNFAQLAIQIEEMRNNLADIQGAVTGAVVDASNAMVDGWNWIKTSKIGKWVGGVFK